MALTIKRKFYDLKLLKFLLTFAVIAYKTHKTSIQYQFMFKNKHKNKKNVQHVHQMFFNKFIRVYM